jgi:hypothetical protein
MQILPDILEGLKKFIFSFVMVREGNPNVCGEFDFGTHLFLHSFIN